MKSIIKLIFAFTLLLRCLPALAQFHPVWDAHYQGIVPFNNNQLLAMAIDNTGYIYVTGMCDNPPLPNPYCQGSLAGTNICTKKYDSFSAHGDSIWTQRVFGCGEDDVRGNTIAVVTVGENTYVYVAGGYNLTDDYRKTDYITIKYDALDGSPLWNPPYKTYDGPLHLKDIATHVDGDASGNVYVTGESEVNSSRYDWITIKYDVNGNPSTSWPNQGDGVGVRRYSGSGNHECVPNMLKVDPSGSFVYITGNSFNSSNNQVITTICYNCSDGAIHGLATYEAGSLNKGNDLAINMQTGIYVIGQSNNKCVTIKYSPDLGQQNWASLTADQGENFSICLYRRPCGRAPCYYLDIFVTGINNIQNKGQTIRYADADGSVVSGWPQLYPSAGSSFVALALDPSENVYVTGNHGNNFLTVEYNSGGTFLDEQSYISTGFSILPVGIRADINGNVFITGTHPYSTLIAAEYLTIKYSPNGSFGPNMLQNPNGIANLTKPIIPKEYLLEQNYPNPFNPATLIRYGMPKAGLVRISVYDILGQEINQLVNEYKEAGYYDVRFDGSNLPSGIYVYKIVSSDFIDTKKMVLIK